LGACSILPASQAKPDGAAAGGNQATLFVPPTLAPAASKTASQPRASKTRAPTAAPRCTDNLVFLDDLSIKDGSVFSPGARLDKRWNVENSGSCNWDQHYRMKLIAGSELGVPPEQDLYPARSGTQAVIRIIFTAPNEPGNYRSAWQAYNPQGEPFGDPFFIDIVVEAPAPTDTP
jgi:hypothetical protein